MILRSACKIIRALSVIDIDQSILLAEREGGLPVENFVENLRLIHVKDVRIPAVHEEMDQSDGVVELQAPDIL